MNKTLLLIVVDFLFLNLIALTRWEKVEPARPVHPPVPSMAANAPTQDQDLVETMRQALADEQLGREELAQKLAGTNQSLAARDQNLAQLQSEKAQLSTTLTDTQRTATELGKQVNTAKEEFALSKDQLAQLQRDLAEKTAEADRQKQALATLEKEQANARKQIEGLTMAVVVGESEKQHLQEQTAQLQGQVAAERSERLKVEGSTAQLAQGVGQLAQKSGELTQEIRASRPININVLYEDFLKNRVQVTFDATRKGLFGHVDRSKDAPSIFITDGKQIYALLHIDDTPFSSTGPNYDWEKIAVRFDHSPNASTHADSILFLEADPRVVAVPVDASQVAQLGAKVYPLAVDPFKFPDAVLISGSKGYGEVGFKLDPSEPRYVRVDNRFFKRLFGDFAPSRGDLVFSHTGELLGIMVNNDYCALLKDFTPLQTIRAGEGVASQQTGQILDGLAARVKSFPPKLQ